MKINVRETAETGSMSEQVSHVRS